MHRSTPSRGRVLFEVLCALGMSALLAGAWMQTHATALLGAAGIAALYALVHLFDLGGPKAAETAEPQRIDFEPEAANVVVPMVALDAEPPVAGDVAPAAAAETVKGRARSGRRSGSRTGGGRRASAPKVAKLVEPEPFDDADMASFEEAETDVVVAQAEAAHFSVAPLFEPEPFARQRHAVFGRKSH